MDYKAGFYFSIFYEPTRWFLSPRISISNISNTFENKNSPSQKVQKFKIINVALWASYIQLLIRWHIKLWNLNLKISCLRATSFLILCK